MLRWWLCLAVAILVFSTASEAVDLSQRAQADTLVTLGPGRAAIWQPLVGANVAVTVNGSAGGGAADVMLMPRKEWLLWQVSKADAAAAHRVRPGGDVSLTQRGNCREQWVLTVSHAWDADTDPQPQPVTVHVIVTADDADCSEVLCMAPAPVTLARVRPSVVPHHTRSILPIDEQRPTCSTAEAACILTGPDTKRFAAWANESSFEMDTVAEASFYGLRGLIATAHIEAGKYAMAVPLSDGLFAPNGRQKSSPLPAWFVSPAFFTAEHGEDVESLPLVLKLLYERHLGKASRRHIYMDNLPRRYSTPVSWTDAELAELQYPSLTLKIKQQRRNWLQVYRDLVASTPGTPITRQDLFWGMNSVESRSFHSPEPEERGMWRPLTVRAAVLTILLIIARKANPATARLGQFVMTGLMIEMVLRSYLKPATTGLSMVPGIDLANHATVPTAEYDYDQTRGRFVLRVGEDGLRAGQQIVCTYSAGTNDAFLVRYGFVERGNPNDVVETPALLQRIRGAELVPHSRFQRLRDLGFEDATLEAEVSRSGIDDGVLAAVRLLLAPPESVGPNATAAHFTQPGEPEEERRVRQVLQSAVRAELKAMRTTVEEDEEKLAHSRHELTERRRLALEFRLEKKRVLLAAIDALA